ncbi:MAG: hypothetical protein K5640_07970, partial [Treponema sp.]|nr:hypothetical protein [Treponema sp.]
MKRIFAVAGILLFAGLFFTGFSPSVDGRAVVAAKGELPEGLFGKTVGYLPGDSVTVINPANGNAVDILVLGSLDPSEGVAILLSSEAADELKIEKDANNLVKLTKRTGKLDEQVYGSATIAKGSEPEENAVNSGTDSVIEEVPQESSVVSPAAESAVVAETAGASYASQEEKQEETDSETKIEYPDENPVEEIVAVDDVPAAAETAVQEEVVESEEIPEHPATVTEAAEVAVAETPAEESVKAEETPAQESVAESAPEEPVEQDEVVADAVEHEVLPTESAASIVTDEPEVQVVEAETEESSKEENSEDSYAPIVLVPASENPPVALENETSDVIQLEVQDTEIAKTYEEEAPIASVAESSEPKEMSDFIVPSLKDLKNGKYYVQISVLKDTENIENLVNS